MLKNRLFKSAYSFLPLTLGVGLTLLPFYSSCKPKTSTSELEMFGGKKDNGKFTSSVAILRTLPDGTWIVTCTATKIAKNMVLTAAHCVLPENGPVDGKMLKPWYEPGTMQRIATGQNANTGVKQDRKIKSVDLFPGLKERFEKCSSNCLNLFGGLRKLPEDLSVRFPDMAIITYESEIAVASISTIGTFEVPSPLFSSGYGVNLTNIEYKKNSTASGIDGDKRFLKFVPKPFSELVSEMNTSIAPLTTDGLDYSEIENELNIFIPMRAPVSNAVLATIRSTKDAQTVEKDMPPLKWDGYAGLIQV